MHYIYALRLVARGFLKCFRGIRGKDIQKIKAVPDMSAGESENLQRRMQVVGLFIPAYPI